MRLPKWKAKNLKKGILQYSLQQHCLNIYCHYLKTVLNLAGKNLYMNLQSFKMIQNYDKKYTAGGIPTQKTHERIPGHFMS